MNAAMSTRELARRTGISQAKISKAENGVRSFTAADLELIFDVLRIEPSIRTRLLRGIPSVKSFEPAPAPVGRVITMKEYTELEGDSVNIVSVERDWIPLPLQTDDYTRRMFDVHMVPGSASQFMRDKIRRKRRLESVRHRYVCIIDETMLDRPLLDSPRWVEQLRWMEERLCKPGVELGIIPRGVVPSLPMYMSCCHDEQSVLLDIRGCDSFLVDDHHHVRKRVAEEEELAKLAVWGGEASKIVREKRRNFETSVTSS